MRAESKRIVTIQGPTRGYMTDLKFCLRSIDIRHLLLFQGLSVVLLLTIMDSAEDTSHDCPPTSTSIRCRKKRRGGCRRMRASRFASV